MQHHETSRWTPYTKKICSIIIILDLAILSFSRWIFIQWHSLTNRKKCFTNTLRQQIYKNATLLRYTNQQILLQSRNIINNFLYMLINHITDNSIQSCTKIIISKPNQIHIAILTLSCIDQNQFPLNLISNTHRNLISFEILLTIYKTTPRHKTSEKTEKNK